MWQRYLAPITLAAVVTIGPGLSTLDWGPDQTDRASRQFNSQPAFGARNRQRLAPEIERLGERLDERLGGTHTPRGTHTLGGTHTSNRTDTSSGTHGPASIPAPSRRQPAARKSQTVAVDIDLTALRIVTPVVLRASLDQLSTEGITRLPHPEGGEMQLVLRRRVVGDGVETLYVTAGVLPGVLTRRGDLVYGALTTERGAYDLSGGENAVYLIDRRSYEARTAGFERDFRRVPIS